MIILLYISCETIQTYNLVGYFSGRFKELLRPRLVLL